MVSETFEIGLGNNNFEVRKDAERDFIQFWNEQAKKLSWFKTWDKTLFLYDNHHLQLSQFLIPSLKFYQLTSLR